MTKTSTNLGNAVNETVELFSALSNIGSETSTSIIEWINEAERECTSTRSGHNIGAQNLPETLLIRLREHRFDGVLKREVARLRREITQNVHTIAGPKRPEVTSSSQVMEIQLQNVLYLIPCSEATRLNVLPMLV